MRISLAALLLLIAFVVVILVELRTVLAVLGVDLPPVAILLIGVVTIGAILFWAIVLPSDDSEGS